MKKNKKKVLFIGWDAADWKVITPLMDAGKMPALQKLIERGVMGNLATLDPPLSPMLWTSIATGKNADKHGILGFIEPDADKQGIRNINSTSRKTRAIWNILHNKGYRSNIISWWPSHPVEPINGVMVSNFFHHPIMKNGKPWLVQDNAVHPVSMLDELAALRVHPIEVTSQMMFPFIPRAKEVDQKKEKSIEGLAKIIAETATVHSVSTYLMENTEWDFMAVYLDGIDHFCHGFMRFHPPQMKGVDDETFDIYKDVVNGAYIFHDMMLERLMQIAGEDTTVILVSDHGFHSDHLRPVNLPKFNAAPAMEHNPLGIFVMAGDGVKKDERVYGATLLDIMPTLLHYLDLPIGRDMDGKILLSIFEESKAPEYIDSWDELPGDFGEHPPHMSVDTMDSAEAMKQLVELGYIEDPGDDRMKAIGKAEDEINYNLSRVLLSNKKMSKARELLEGLLEANQDDIRYNSDIIPCYLAEGETEKAWRILNRLKNIPDDDKNKRFVNIDLLEAKILIAEFKTLKALNLVREMLKKHSLNIGLIKESGRLFSELGNYSESIKTYQSLLKIDPDNAIAYYGLAYGYLKLGDYELAAENALNSIGIIYNLHQSHFVLGDALFNLEQYEPAAHAFEQTVHILPKHMKARLWLVLLYEDYLHNPERASYHQKIIDDYMKGKITVVSGLPRSGTSMMMQMLEGGGLDVFTDKTRSADDNNPKGYYEFEKVKALNKNSSWMGAAEGKTIKVIAQLLQFLPTDYEYRVVFMLRDLNEILKSQQIMLGRDPKIYPASIASSFKKDLEKATVWLRSQPNIKVVFVNYSDVLDNPIVMANEINRFLDYQLNVDDMIARVDKKLYRNKVDAK